MQVVIRDFHHMAKRSNGIFIGSPDHSPAVDCLNMINYSHGILRTSMYFMNALFYDNISQNFNKSNIQSNRSVVGYYLVVCWHEG